MCDADERSCCLYYGAAITSRAKRERSLPLINPATTNRMLRIAAAFNAAGMHCAILSPAIMPRISGGGGWMCSIAQRVSGVPILSIRQLRRKYIGYLLTPFTAIAAAVVLARRRKIKTIVQYCYFPDAFLFSLWCKIAYGSKVVLDLEDICRPRLADWKPGSETRPVLQLWGWCLMKLSVWLADMVIMPTAKFSPVVPEKKRLVISGCQNVSPDDAIKPSDGEIRLLFSGGITEENGIVLLFDALKRLDGQERNFNVSVCGMGCRKEWAEDRAKELVNIDATVLGFLDSDAFVSLYKETDACFAIQNPYGRHGQFKTPSKGYEALCSGKLLIVSDIGDFGELPDKVCYHLRPYSAETLAEILESLTQDVVNAKRRAALEYARQNFDVRVIGEMLKKRLSN